jgi:hypothetical protein
MSQNKNLKSSIKKNLNKVIKESQMNFGVVKLHFDELLEPTIGRTPPNSFMLYCKDRASVIKNKPGENSKHLGQMWKNELHDVRKIYETLSNVMTIAYKEVFGNVKPWENSASMPAFCLTSSQNSEAQNTQYAPFITDENSMSQNDMTLITDGSPMAQHSTQYSENNALSRQFTQHSEDNTMSQPFISENQDIQENTTESQPLTGESQDTQRIHESQPFIDERSAPYLSYYNL